MSTYYAVERATAALFGAPAHVAATPIPTPVTPQSNGSVTISVATLVGFAALLVVLLLILLLLLRARGRTAARPSSRGQALVAHFVPDEVTLVVQHAPGASASDILQGVARDSRIAASGELGNAVARSGRVTTLSRGASQAVSLVVATVQGIDQAGVLKLINGLQRQLIGGQNGPAGSTAGVTIVSAAPNWLTSSCHPVSGGGGGGVGGPGGMPGPPAGAIGPGAWRLNLPASLSAAGNGGEGVHVAIMDTAPCDSDLQQAYERWGMASHGQPSAQHELIASLLRPGGPLKVYHAGSAHLLQTVDFRLDAHHYPMPDHGLFVAGIVHSLAPNAQIHLIEALNSYGVGTLETFAQAFRVAQLLAEGRDLGRVGDGAGGDVDTLAVTAVGTVATVLNCSFMFNVASNAGADDPELQADAELTTAMGHFPNVWQALIGNEHAPIVAAAGNDRTVAQFSRGTYPGERYPAAFDDVIGVGALDSSGSPTMYTDRAQAASGTGIAVFGGDVVPAGGVDAPSPYIADGNRGILGIFVGTKFPDGTPNRSGWARWAGTSFSAPIVTGMIARSLSSRPPSEGGARALYDHVINPLVAASVAETPVGKSLSVSQG